MHKPNNLKMVILLFVLSISIGCKSREKYSDSIDRSPAIHEYTETAKPVDELLAQLDKLRIPYSNDAIECNVRFTTEISSDRIVSKSRQYSVSYSGNKITSSTYSVFYTGP